MGSKAVSLTVNFDNSTPLQAVWCCLCLAVAYVGSLYVWKLPLPRDHPASIRQRFRRVAVVSLLAPLCLWMISSGPASPSNTSAHVDPSSFASSVRSLLVLFGIHSKNILPAAILPLILTVVLFLGPIALEYCVRNSPAFWDGREHIPLHRLVFELTWQRTFVVAPFTEEFVFRACMLPLLVPHFGVLGSVFLCPLFFGVAHAHHCLERLQAKEPWLQVWISALFQMAYTTVFGAYSAFLFLRTGHLVGPVLCHSFCNFMGFPEFDRIEVCGHPKVVSVAFIIGLVAFFLVLMPLTNPLYFESIYWT